MKWHRYLLIAVLTIGLILVRYFEDVLFYDPFLAYFKGDFLNTAFRIPTEKYIYCF